MFLVGARLFLISLVIVAAAPPAAAAPPSVVVPRPVAAEVRAAGVLWAASLREDAGVVRCAEAAAMWLRKNAPPQGPPKPLLASLTRFLGAQGKLDATGRRALYRQVREPSRLEAEATPARPASQLEAYARLVEEVSRSAARFAEDNVSSGEERDTLADRAAEAGGVLAGTLGRRGYGAAQAVAGDIQKHIRAALDLLSDMPLASGARSLWDQIGRCTGAPEAEVKASLERAAAVERLVGALADDFDRALAKTAPERRAFARGVGREGAAARSVLARPEPPSAAPPGAVLKLLCFDDGKLTPCDVKPAP